VAAFFGGPVPMRRLGALCLVLGLTAPALAAEVQREFERAKQFVAVQRLI